MNMYYGVMGKKITGVEPMGTHLVIVLEDESRLTIEPGATFNIGPDGAVRLSLWQHIRLEKGTTLVEEEKKRKDLSPDGHIEDQE